MKKKYLFLAVFGIFAISLSACTKPETKSNDAYLENENVDLSNMDELYGITQLDSSAESLNSISTSSDKIANDSKIEEKQIITLEKENVIKKDMTIDPNNFEELTSTYSSAIIKTSLGDIKVKFYAAESPKTVNNFLNLAKLGFYNGTKFHRIIKDFMIQGGDPISKTTETSSYGTGGPGYKFADEFNNHKLVEGSLAMANSGPNTNGSQFFIVTLDATPWLDGAHTNFGQVVSGMDIVKKIEAAETNSRDLPLTAITINSIELVK